MGTAASPAAPPCPVRNTASWSGTAYSSGQAWLISQLTLISGGRSPIRHVGTRRVGDGRPTAEMEAVWPQWFAFETDDLYTQFISSDTHSREREPYRGYFVMKSKQQQQQ